MRGGGGPIAAVGASLALLVAVPLIAVHVAGAGRVASPGDRRRPGRRRPRRGERDAPRRDGLRGDPVAAAGGCRPGRRAVRPAARVQQRPERQPGALRRRRPDGRAPAAHVVRAQRGRGAGLVARRLAGRLGERRRGRSRPPPHPRRPSARGAADARACRRPRARVGAERPADRVRLRRPGRLRPLVGRRAGRRARALSTTPSGRHARPTGTPRATASPSRVSATAAPTCGSRASTGRRGASRPRRGTTAGPTGRPTAAPSRSSEGVEARSSRGSSGRPAGPRRGSGGCRAEPAR